MTCVYITQTCLFLVFKSDRKSNSFCTNKRTSHSPGGKLKKQPFTNTIISNNNNKTLSLLNSNIFVDLTKKKFAILFHNFSCSRKKRVICLFTSEMKKK